MRALASSCREGWTARHRQKNEPPKKVPPSSRLKWPADSGRKWADKDARPLLSLRFIPRQTAADATSRPSQSSAVKVIACQRFLASVSPSRRSRDTRTAWNRTRRLVVYPLGGPRSGKRSSGESGPATARACSRRAADRRSRRAGLRRGARPAERPSRAGQGRERPPPSALPTGMRAASGTTPTLRTRPVHQSRRLAGFGYRHPGSKDRAVPLHVLHNIFFFFF